tara:strand:+ start:396 stop:617 length:222 start_codon:yes stop_codon:yes gene_type:complete
MKTKYTGKLKIKDWESPLEINFLDGFHDYKLNDKTIMESAMEYLIKDDLDCIVGVKLTVYKNGKRLNAIKIVK